MTLGLRRQVAWLALALAVFASVAPVISRWLAPAGGPAWAEVCSVGGPKRVALDTGSTPVPAGDHAGTTHCPFCRLQSHLPPIAPTEIAFALTPRADRDAASPREAPAVRGRPLWTSAPSRAPPFVS